MRLRRSSGLAATLYVSVIFAYFILPLDGRFGEAMLGTSLFPHDAMLNAGILEWGRRALASDALQLFEWPAGFPLHNSLANTENLLGWQPWYAALRSAGATVTFSYNTLIVFSFLLSAIGARLVAGRLGSNQEGALLAGLIFAFTPFHLTHAIHLQTLSVCWVPFAIYFLDRFLSTGKAVDLVCVSAFAALCLLSGLYIGFFLAIALPAYVAASLITRRVPLRYLRLCALMLAAIVTAALLWPVLGHYVAYARRYGYVHPVEVMTRFSIELLALAKVPAWVEVWSKTGYPGLTRHESAAFPGIVALALACYALRGWRDPDRRSSVWFLLALMLVFFSFALGPRLLFHENVPVSFAARIPLPGQLFETLSFVRWPMRAFFFTLLFGAVLAGLGFTFASRDWSARRRTAACAVLVFLIVLEYKPLNRYAADSRDVPEPLALSDAYPFLAAEEDRGGVLELPVADKGGYRTPMMVRSVYGAAGHLRPVVAIHGQDLPPLTRALIAEAEMLPGASAVDHLRRYDCSRIVIHRGWPDADHKKLEDTIVGLRQAGLPALWDSRESVVFALR